MSRVKGADRDSEVLGPESVPAATAPTPTTRERTDVIEQEMVAERLHDAPPEQRTLTSKMFGIGFSGYFQLVVVCIVAGAVFQAGGIDIFAPDFSLQRIPGAVANGALSVLGWVIEVGWRPFLTGLFIVVPVWLAWRLLTVPFRN
jgi:hypothetical protein